MHRSYFLGGATPDGFHTNFWREHQHDYGIFLKGGPGTGKSTLMKKLAGAFPEENVSLYHCASDPRSLDAVVFEARHIFIADATAPHEAGTPLPGITGEYLDLAASLDMERLAPHAAEIHRQHDRNLVLHGQVRKGLTAMAAMQHTILEAGTSALQTDKLTAFAGRLAKRLFPKPAGSTGNLHRRQHVALTPMGRMQLIPDDWERLVLHDDCYAAAFLLLEQLTQHAMRCGLDCEVSQSMVLRGCTHLLIPDLRLALFLESESPLQQESVTTMDLRRFYCTEHLRPHRNLIRFCTRTNGSLQQTCIALLEEALACHDALEAPYIGALNRSALDETAASLAHRIARLPADE